MLRRDAFDESLLDDLRKAPDALPRETEVAILAYGQTALEPLCRLLGDFESEWGEIHAVALMGRIGAGPVVGRLVAALAECDPIDLVYGELLTTLAAAGEAAVRPLLSAMARADNITSRDNLAAALAHTPGRRKEVREVLEQVLAEEPSLGASLLAEYGDPRALPALSVALDNQKIDSAAPPPFANQEIVELDEAIRDLGGELTPAQRTKVRAVEALSNAWRPGMVPPSTPAAERPGRNDPCWCGSGKKYKRCHLREDAAAPA